MSMHKSNHRSKTFKFVHFEWLSARVKQEAFWFSSMLPLFCSCVWQQIVDLWGRSYCGADVGLIYGAGAAVRQMCVRSIWQVLLWVICVSDLWGRICCGADVGKIYGAGDALGQMWVRSMGQELLWG